MTTSNSWSLIKTNDYEDGHKRTNGTKIVQSMVVFLRVIGLSVLGLFVDPHSTLEPAKIVTHRNTRIAGLRLAIHIIPLAAALTLIGLNARGTLSSTYSWLSGLQFVAKFHEILMQASLASLIMAYVRHQALFQKSIPFGSIFPGIQVSNIGYLWSLELRGTLSASWMPTWARVKLGAVIIVTIGLAAVVGPSSAILMIPRQCEVPFSNFYMAMDSLAPIVFLKELSHNVGGISFSPAYDMVFPSSVAFEFAAPFSHRVIYWTSIVGPTARDSGPTEPNGIARVSSLAHTVVPVILLGDMVTSAIPDHKYLGDVRSELTSQVISVAAFCSPVIELNTSTPGVTIEYPSANGAKLDIGMTHGQALAARSPEGPFAFIFSSPPDTHSAHVSLLALIVFLPPRDLTNYSSYARPCALKASWQSAQYNITTPHAYNATFAINWKLDGEHESILSSEQMENAFDRKFNPFEWPEPAIPIHPNWIPELQLDVNQLENSSVTAIEAIAASYSFYRTGWDTKALESPYSLDFDAMSTTITSLVASAVGSINCIEQGGPYTPCQAASALAVQGNPNTTAAYQRSTNRLPVRNYFIGIGYTIEVWPVVLSACILAFYCLVTMAFIVYSLVTGVSSSAWDSASEITALALYSQVPKTSGHMSAGLGTLNIFRRRVAIMENEDSNLEIVFREQNGDEETGYEGVKYNKYY